jgi:hypothetical protein
VQANDPQPEAAGAAADAAPGAPPRAIARPGRVLAALLCAAAAFLLYASCLDDDFLGDDYDLIRSFHDQPAAYFVRLLWTNESGEVWKELGMEAGSGLGYLRPLKIWLLAFDLAAWGPDATGFHLTAGLLFALVVALVFLLLDALLPGRRPLALLGAGAAAMHPVFAEIVPFVTAREETLALAFVLAAVHAFVGLRERGRPAWPFHALLVGGLLSKESAITIVPLVLGWDLVHGRLSPRRPGALRDALRVHGPTAAILVGYFALRWAAFGNLQGGENQQANYGSPVAFLTFHLRFFPSLVGEDLFAGARVPGAGWVVGGAALLSLLLVVRRGLDRRARADLLFLGPVWYLASMSIYYGTYFSNRHHALLVVGVVLFATRLLAELLRGASRGQVRGVAAAAALACALACLPPTLAMVSAFDAAAATVREMRARIERETAALPDGSRVLLTHVPQKVVPPWYFGWGLGSALSPPFAPSDPWHRLQIVNHRQRAMTFDDSPLPESYDLRLDLRLDLR